MSEAEKKYDITKPAWELAYEAAGDKRMDILALASGMLAGELFKLRRTFEDIVIICTNDGDAEEACEIIKRMAENALSQPPRSS